MYAQTNYLQKQGRKVNGVLPQFPISEIGCLLTGKSNVLLDFGITADPLMLNAFFRDHLVYIDVDDGVYDDLTWSSVSAYAPKVVVTSTGTGWPSSNKSIVKFAYKSPRTGKMTTHFSKVANVDKHTIIDSWDGKEKSPGVYGEPVAYATYGVVSPEPVIPITAPAPAANTGRQIFLPSAAGTWRAYPLGALPVPGNEVGKLAPGNFPPGLTYDILDTPAPNVYTIITQSYGRVNVWGGSNTIAQFKDKPAPTPPPAPIQAAAPVVVPAPETVPPPVSTPVVADDTKVEVKVIHTEAAWKKIFKDEHTYFAMQHIPVVDLEGLAPTPVPLERGDKIVSAGKIVKDGKEYILTQKSIANKTFYGVPKVLLEPDSPPADDKPFDTSFKDELDEIKRSKRKTVLAVVASVEGFFTFVWSKIKKNKKGAK